MGVVPTQPGLPVFPLIILPTGAAETNFLIFDYTQSNKLLPGDTVLDSPAPTITQNAPSDQPLLTFGKPSVEGNQVTVSVTVTNGTANCIWPVYCTVQTVQGYELTLQVFVRTTGGYTEVVPGSGTVPYLIPSSLMVPTGVSSGAVGGPGLTLSSAVDLAGRLTSLTASVIGNSGQYNAIGMGAVADGTGGGTGTDNTTVLQDALNAINAAGGGVLRLPFGSTGIYRLDGTLTWLGSNPLSIDADSGVVIDGTNSTASSLIAMGGQRLGSAALAASTIFGQTYIESALSGVVAGDLLLITTGDWCQAAGNDPGTYAGRLALGNWWNPVTTANYFRGEIVEVDSVVSGSPNTFYLKDPLNDAYSAAVVNGTSITAVHLLEMPSVAVNNVGIVCNPAHAQRGLNIEYARDVVVSGCNIKGASYACVQLFYIFGGVIQNNFGENFFLANEGTCYGLDVASSQNLLELGNRFRGGRSGIAHGGNEPCRNIKAIGNVLGNYLGVPFSTVGAVVGALDAHGNCEHMQFSHNTVLNGILFSGVNSEITDNTIYVSGSVTSCVQWTPETSSRYMRISGNKLKALGAFSVAPIGIYFTTLQTGSNLTFNTVDISDNTSSVNGVLPPMEISAPSQLTTGGSIVPGTYYFKLSALSPQGETVLTSEISVVVPAGTNTNQITLNWLAYTNNLGYNVYGTNASQQEYSLLATAASGATSIALLSLPGAPTLTSISTSGIGGTLPAAHYYFKLAALTSSGLSFLSNEENIATTGSTSTISLDWNSFAGATAYYLYEGFSANGENILLAILPSGTTSYTVTGSEVGGNAYPGALQGISIGLYMACTTTSTTITIYDLILSNNRFTTVGTPFNLIGSANLSGCFYFLHKTVVDGGTYYNCGAINGSVGFNFVNDSYSFATIILDSVRVRTDLPGGNPALITIPYKALIENCNLEGNVDAQSKCNYTLVNAGSCVCAKNNTVMYCGVDSGWNFTNSSAQVEMSENDYVQCTGTIANSGSFVGSRDPNAGLPTATIGAGAGSGASVTLSSGSLDQAGTITLVTAGTPSANAIQFTVNFGTDYPAAPRTVLVTPASPNAIGLFAEDAAVRTAGSFAVYSGSTAPATGQTYKLNWQASY